MKRYARTDLSEAMKLALLDRLGTVREIVGNTARVVVEFGEKHVLEIYTGDWRELMEVSE